MAYPKGGPKVGGRKKGTPNKQTAALKDMILTALEGADKEGSVAYLTKQAAENPTAFLTLVGKVLPLQVNADVNAQVVGVITFKGLNE